MPFNKRPRKNQNDAPHKPNQDPGQYLRTEGGPNRRSVSRGFSCGSVQSHLWGEKHPGGHSNCHQYCRLKDAGNLEKYRRRQFRRRCARRPRERRYQRRKVNEQERKYASDPGYPQNKEKPFPETGSALGMFHAGILAQMITRDLQIHI